MAFSISYIFQAIDKFTSPASSINRSIDAMKNKTRQLASELEKAKKKSEETGKSLSNSFIKAGNRINMMGRSFAMLNAPMVGVGVMAAKQTAAVESLTMALEGLFKNKGKALNMMKDLQSFSKKTPFSLGDTAAATKQLLAAGVKPDKVMSAVSMIADVAAGSGSSMEDVGSMLARAKLTGKVGEQDIMQLHANGAPILASLKHVFRKHGLSEAQIMKVAQKGRVSFDAFNKALIHMTSEGQAFHKQTDKWAKSLEGAASILKNQMLHSLDLIGKQILIAFGGHEGVQGFIKNIEKMHAKLEAFFKNNPRLTKFIILFTAAAAATALILIPLGALIKLIGMVSVAISVLGVALKGLFLNPIGLAVLAVAALVTGLIYAYKNSEKFRNIIKTVGSVIKSAALNMWDFIKPLLKLLWVISPIGALITIGKKLYDSWKPFKDLIDWLINAFSNLPEKINGFFKAQVPAIAGLPTGTDRIRGLSTNSIVAQSTAYNRGQRITGDINTKIEIIDKGHNVKSVRTTKTGFLERAVGKNMPRSQ